MLFKRISEMSDDELKWSGARLRMAFEETGQECYRATAEGVDDEAVRRMTAAKEKEGERVDTGTDE